jgi:hypothetical protein
MVNPGSKLNYNQWRSLSGGNSRGYRRYEREYKIYLDGFYKGNGFNGRVAENNDNYERRTA